MYRCVKNTNKKGSVSLKHKIRKFTSVLLAIMMLFGTVSVSSASLDLTPLGTEKATVNGQEVNVGEKVKFACVDGPEFDGHLVDFDESMRRQTMYKTEEGREQLKIEEGDTHNHGGCGCKVE